MSENADANYNRTQHAKNRKAFEDILGDPFAMPDSIDGHYHRMKFRSLLMAAKFDFDEGTVTANSAKPTAVDFYCDVELMVREVITDEESFMKFIETYLTKPDGLTDLTAIERDFYEQRLGRMFRARGISPVAKYFTAIRQQVHRPNQELV
jgi:DNA-binding phage protein